MSRSLAVALAALTLASCKPTSDDMLNTAAQACQRSDIEDVVSKETRNLMVKPNIEKLLVAEWWGLDVKEILAQIEGARVSFDGVGTMTHGAPGQQFTQIICGGKLQLDMSTGLAGQQIFGIPRLRWAINFPEPTSDPLSGGFSVEVDPDSIHDGMTFNGMPARSEQADGSSGDGSAGAAIDAEAADPGAGQHADSAAEAAAAAAKDFDAASQVDAAPSRQRTAPADKSVNAPSEDDLYAPHGN